MPEALSRSEPHGEPLVVRVGPLDVSVAVESGGWPEPVRLAGLAQAAVAAVLDETGAEAAPGAELSILFVDDRTVRVLNAGWRGQDKATNVLSFPLVRLAPGDALPPALGDVVLAAETVAREAAAEGRPLDHHIAHLVVHGVLHLMGHDHGDDREAEAMESLERRALARLAIPDPYL